MPAFNIRADAYLLPAYARDFPPGTVFVGVVDPGAELPALATSADFAPALGAQLVTWVRDGIEQAHLRLHPADRARVRDVLLGKSPLVGARLDSDAARGFVSPVEARVRMGLHLVRIGGKVFVENGLTAPHQLAV